ncbi:MAG: heme exporter protein CcmD [Gammaproteobacteria bacterium]|nr:heme exporter protein CcmD [Gammaproteobacteria bacterium]
MSEFLNMGGYAAYVWPSYGLAAVVLWLNWYLPRRQHEQLLLRLKRQHRDTGEQKHDPRS